MKDKIIRLLEQKNYVPGNVPELLRLLRLPPNRQQELQAVLRELEQIRRSRAHQGQPLHQCRAMRIWFAGRIRMNRAGKGFLQPDDSTLEGNCHSRKRHRHGVARGPRAGAPRCARRNFATVTPRPARWCAFSNGGARRSSARCRRANSFSTSSPMTRASRMTSM